MFYRFALTVILFTCIGATALSQNDKTLPKSFIPPSPNAANLGLYTSVPVDAYSGLPGITVPIHTFKINGLNLNINLSYHAGGIRKSDEASWVGLGWSLNAGGVISRTKRGKDDLGPKGFYKIDPSNRPCDASYDQEPDLFYLNFAGFTGQFFLENTPGSVYPTIRTTVKSGLKIYTTPTGGWKVVDENGITYEFEQKENATDVFTHPDYSETESYVSSWYLTKVTNTFGETINLFYSNTGNKIYKRIGSHSTKQLVGWAPSDLFSNYVMIGNQTGLDYYNGLIKSYTTESYDEITTDEIVLTEIWSEYDMVDFIASDRTDLKMQSAGMVGKKLDQVQVKTIRFLGRPYGTIIKSFNLVYDYFNSNSGQPDNISKRLQLKSVQEVSGSSNIAPFTFSYTTNILPDKNSSGGFLTNVTDGLLNKVVYPTGGYTTYEYEAHYGSQGARIKRVSQTDFTGTYNTRYFEYQGGKLLGLSIPFSGIPSSVSLGATMILNGQATPISAGLAYMTSFYSDEQMMGESSSSYLVGYDKVIEYFGATGEFGKTEYTFFNQQSSQAYWVPADVSNENGFLLSKQDFAFSNNAYIPVKKTDYQVNIVNVSTVQARRRIINGDCNHNYPVKSDWLQVTGETETTYDQNGNNPLAKTIAYTYSNPDHIYPTAEQSTDSKNAIWNITNKYTSEKSAQEGGVYTTMLQNNIIRKLEVSVTKDGQQISKTKTNYKDWYGNGAMLVPETEEFQKGSNNSEVRVRYYSYNDNGRPIEFAKEDGARTKYIWGYQNTLPIAEIRHANVNDYVETVTENHVLLANSPVFPGNYNVGTITLDHAQTINVSGSLVQTGGSYGDLLAFSIVITDYANSDVQYYVRGYGPGTSANDPVSLPKGTYNVYYDFKTIDDQSDLQMDLNLSITQSRFQINPACFYTSFEEEDGLLYTAESFTGVNSHPGTYTLAMPGAAGKYKLSWWQKPINSGSWEFKQQSITVNAPGAPAVTIGAQGSIIDELRLLPEGALMTTYTYDPQKGMTTKNDEKNQVTFYEYDELGRLKVVRDHQKNILKTYSYTYQEDQQ